MKISTSRNDVMKPRFIILSTYGELMDLVIWLDKVESYEAILAILDKDYSEIGEGIVHKDNKWWDYLGKDYIFVIDGTENAELCDWLSDIGELVVGTNKTMANLEDDRGAGQTWFKKAGFMQPKSEEFSDIPSAIKFIEGNKDKRWILKQQGTAPKHLNHMGKFDGSEDMLFHLQELEKSWDEAEWGPVAFQLMEVVEGIELAASAFFNGTDWMRNENGKVVGYLNFEFKKHMNGDLGPTTGEMGTLFLGVDEDNETFKDIILRPEIANKLRESNYRGVFDINCIKTDKGMVALEATSRFGVPATSYEFGEGLETPVGELLQAMAEGTGNPVEVYRKWGIAQVIVAPPFPVEADLDTSATSLGEKLWVLNDKEPVEDFSMDQWRRIHLENFKRTDEGYRVATKGGYMLVVTGMGDKIEEVREELLDYIKQNIFLSDMSYRTDIGKRIEPYEEELS